MRTAKNVQIPGSLLGRFKGERKGYRPDILSYNAKTIQLTKFSAKRSLADTEEGDENENEMRMKNGSFLHSTAQKHRQAQVSVVHWGIFRCSGKHCILMVTEERMIVESKTFTVCS